MSEGTQQSVTPSDRFREIADKIDRNKPEDFSGAFLIVTPDGETISGILVGQPDIAAFFGLLSGKLQVAINTAEDKQKINRNFQR